MVLCFWWTILHVPRFGLVPYCFRFVRVVFWCDVFQHSRWIVQDTFSPLLNQGVTGCQMFLWFVNHGWFTGYFCLYSTKIQYYLCAHNKQNVKFWGVLQTLYLFWIISPSYSGEIFPYVYLPRQLAGVIIFNTWSDVKKYLEPRIWLLQWIWNPKISGNPGSDRRISANFISSHTYAVWDSNKVHQAPL